jgi:predicted small secreted protein
MKTLPVLLLAITSLLLTSCSVTVQPGPGIDVHAVGVSGDVLVNERLGVRGYPGAVLVKQEQKGESSKTTFETGASIDAVYAHFHSQLTSRGWQRYELNSKPNQVKAEYAMGGEELELKLDREGRSGRYRLELDLD